MKLTEIQGRREVREPLVIRKGYEHGQEIAKRRCVHCHKPIGYGKGFWFVTPMRPEVYHAKCLGGLGNNQEAN